MNLDRQRHTHTYTHPLFLACQLRELRDLELACGPCSQTDDEKLGQKMSLSWLCRFLMSFPLFLMIIFHPHAFLLILTCPRGWLTQVMLMFANSASNFALLFHWFKARLMLYSPTFPFIAEPRSRTAPGKTLVESTAMIWLAQSGPVHFLVSCSLSNSHLQTLLARCCILICQNFKSTLFMTKKKK